MKLTLLSSLLLLSATAAAQSPAPMRWLNAPKKVVVSGSKVQVQVEGGTDFWRVTHYGFIRDNGHF